MIKGKLFGLLFWHAAISEALYYNTSFVCALQKEKKFCI